MSGKVVMLMVDAIGFQPGIEVSGALEGWVEEGQARRFKMRSCLPSLSVPCYLSIQSGTTPQEHGFLTNYDRRRFDGPSTFSLAQAAGKVTAAVAHFNFSDMFNRTPYDPGRDCEVDDPALLIQHGRFYEETGASAHNACLHGIFDICARGTNLMTRFSPDYLFLHCVGPDHVGHVKGAASEEYRAEIWEISDALGMYAPRWREAGYRVLVTADHGMSAGGSHGGTTAEERDVPFWDLGHPRGGVHAEEVSQLSAAPTVLDILGLPIPKTMKAPSLAR